MNTTLSTPLPTNHVDATFENRSFYDDGQPCEFCETTVKRTSDQSCKNCYDRGETLQQRRQREAAQAEYGKRFFSINPKTREEAIALGLEHYGRFECDGVFRKPFFHRSPRRVA